MEEFLPHYAHNGSTELVLECVEFAICVEIEEKFLLSASKENDSLPDFYYDVRQSCDKLSQQNVRHCNWNTNKLQQHQAHDGKQQS